MAVMNILSHYPLRYTVTVTPVGDVILGAKGQFITGIYFADHCDSMPGIIVPASDPVLEPLAMQLYEYFDGTRIDFDFLSSIKGNAFQYSVWSQLKKIPYGQSATYGQIATALGNANKARAVGQAVGANPLSIVVPCHRVVGANDIGGYAGGISRKRYLLDLEKMVCNYHDQRLF
ncbi:MAG: methylated-DNA--[protein]-cysteine S-methyltransferase [Actinomycetaceae bacterium]|nr:methylated-DNA--[protein]-cysteine S-methyltransferase [Actinomycetaceae bacterium]